MNENGPTKSLEGETIPVSSRQDLIQANKDIITVHDGKDGKLYANRTEGFAPAISNSELAQIDANADLIRNSQEDYKAHKAEQAKKVEKAEKKATRIERLKRWGKRTVASVILAASLFTLSGAARADSNTGGDNEPTPAGSSATDTTETLANRSETEQAPVFGIDLIQSGYMALDADGNEILNPNKTGPFGEYNQYNFTEAMPNVETATPEQAVEYLQNVYENDPLALSDSAGLLSQESVEELGIEDMTLKELGEAMTSDADLRQRFGEEFYEQVLENPNYTFSIEDVNFYGGSSYIQDGEVKRTTHYSQRTSTVLSIRDENGNHIDYKNSSAGGSEGRFVGISLKCAQNQRKLERYISERGISIRKTTPGEAQTTPPPAATTPPTNPETPPPAPQEKAPETDINVNPSLNPEAQINESSPPVTAPAESFQPTQPDVAPAEVVQETPPAPSQVPAPTPAPAETAQQVGDTVPVETAPSQTETITVTTPVVEGTASGEVSE